MSSLSVSTSSEVCRHLFALLYFYCVKSRIQRTQLDGKKKIDYFDSETFGIGCGLLQCMAWGGQSGAAVRRPHGNRPVGKKKKKRLMCCGKKDIMIRYNYISEVYFIWENAFQMVWKALRTIIIRMIFMSRNTLTNNSA